MSVQVRSAPLRAGPSYLASGTTTLEYGDRVVIVEKRTSWFLCRHPDGRQGWLHESALSTKRIVMQASDSVATTASSREVALAGKGFNQQVEHEFKNRNPSMDFTWVDRMESMAITEAEIRRFIMVSKTGD